MMCRWASMAMQWRCRRSNISMSCRKSGLLMQCRKSTFFAQSRPTVLIQLDPVFPSSTNGGHALKCLEC
eukprot:1568818-Rhodomonas_salina.2